MLDNITKRIVSFTAAAVMIASNTITISPITANSEEFPENASGTPAEEKKSEEEESGKEKETEKDKDKESEKAAESEETSKVTTEEITPVAKKSDDMGQTSSASKTKKTAYKKHAFVLSPDPKSSEIAIKLIGAIPEDAVVKAVDVSENNTGFAAYDISVTVGGEDFAPDGGVEIKIFNPSIVRSEALEVWQTVGGERSQISGFTAKDGEISVHMDKVGTIEIVDNSENKKKADEFFEGLAKRGENGFTASFAGGYFTTGEQVDIEGQGGRKGFKLVSSSDEAAKLCFEQAGDNNHYYLFFKDGDGNKTYLRMFKGVSFGSDAANVSALAAAGYGDRSVFAVYADGYDTSRLKVSCEISGETHYWTAGGGNSFIAGVKDSANIAYMTLTDFENDTLELDGKSFGIMFYEEGDSGKALNRSDDKTEAKDYDVKVSENDGSKSITVDDKSGITLWTFENVGKKQYKIKASDDKYLTLDGDKLAFTDDKDSAAKFKVSKKSGGAVAVSSDGKYISFDGSEFVTSSDSAELNLVSLYSKEEKPKAKMEEKKKKGAPGGPDHGTKENDIQIGEAITYVTLEIETYMVVDADEHPNGDTDYNMVYQLFSWDDLKCCYATMNCTEAKELTETEYAQIGIYYNTSFGYSTKVYKGTQNVILRKPVDDDDHSYSIILSNPSLTDYNLLGNRSRNITINKDDGTNNYKVTFVVYENKKDYTTSHGSLKVSAAKIETD